MMIKMIIKMMMKNPPGPYINHMLESDGVKRRALRARRLERPPMKRHQILRRNFCDKNRYL